MRKYLYILTILFIGCVKDDTTPFYSGDGEVTLALELRLHGADEHLVTTRTTGSGWADKENVTQITGYAFVFGNDPNLEGTYGDDSPLLQKVAFKSIDNGAKTTIYVTLDEQTEPCFIRLMTSMTQAVRDQIDGFTSQKQIDEGVNGSLTIFADYKHISVSLDGYYQMSDLDNDIPNPSKLTSNLAFPLASPGINMPNGLNEATVEAMNKIAFMVPVASKVDVTSLCDFDLQQVTLLNGARKARLRSTVITDDGLDIIYSLPLPTNLGGITLYEAVGAVGGTTAATPIYFFPNKGDGGFDTPADPNNEYPLNNTTLSDEINTKNPTYLIVKGRAAGYDVDGYYKIAIRYQIDILGADGEPTGTYSDFTYDIVRNNHYKVRLMKVDNPGYATFEEAAAGVANDIAYDVAIDGEYDDPRAETIVSHNGLFYVTLVGTEIFAQGYGSEGVSGSFDLKRVRNGNIPDGYSLPTLYITATDGITINNDSYIMEDNFEGTINFTATTSGVITIRCGDMLKEIPVHYDPTPHIWQSGLTIGGAELSTISEVLAENSSDANDIDMIAVNGSIAENTTYRNREFRGKIYPSDMSKGIRKVYCKQASNFELNTFYDNTSAGYGGTSGANNIFTTTSTDVMNSVYSASINYQSTGKVYQINSVNQGSLNSEDIMDSWYIGDAPIDFTAKGKFSVDLSGEISTYFTLSDWNNLSDGVVARLDAADIGTNQIGEYDPDRAEVNDSIKLTLTNIAGQRKVYNIDLMQYARPYVDNSDITYDPNTGIYSWDCPLIADIYWIGSNNVGEYVDSPIIYNARYKSGEEGYGDWSWSEAPTEGDWRGEADGVTYVRAAFNIQPVPDYQGVPTTSDYYFRIKVDGSSSVIRNNWQAYFDLKMSNGANEQIFFRFKLRRDD